MIVALLSRDVVMKITRAPSMKVQHACSGMHTVAAQESCLNRPFTYSTLAIPRTTDTPLQSCTCMHVTHKASACKVALTQQDSPLLLRTHMAICLFWV